MTINTSIVSPNVGEELRRYAQGREEEMRDRVADFKRKMQENYFKVEQESLGKIDLIQRISTQEGMDSLDLALRSLDDLIDRFRHPQSLGDPSTSSPSIGEQMKSLEFARRENLKFVQTIVDEKISEFLVNKKRQVQNKYDRLGMILNEIRHTDLDWIDQVCDHPKFDKILSEINEANLMISSARKTVQSTKTSLANTVNLEARNLIGKECDSLQSEVVNNLNSLTREYEEEMKLKNAKSASVRRRILIAIQKRIHDIQHGLNDRKREVVALAVSEYRDELFQLFKRYLNIMASDSFVVPNESPRIDFESIWNKRSPPSLAYRIKFIQLFLERFGSDPTLAHHLYNVFQQY